MTDAELSEVMEAAAVPDAEESAELMEGETLPVPVDGEGLDVAEVVLQILNWLTQDGETDKTDMELIAGTVQEIHDTVLHPALTTPFADYTVTEALLLFLALFQIVRWALGQLRGAFEWLL